MKPALVISDRDNVATALEALDAGQAIDVGGRTIVVRERIASGHKVALVDITGGQPVMKYGSAIGVATADIAQGTHVHTHNLASTRGRGDLRPSTVAPDPAARLAEPAEHNGLTAEVDRPGGSRD